MRVDTRDETDRDCQEGRKGFPEDEAMDGKETHRTEKLKNWSATPDLLDPHIFSWLADTADEALFVTDLAGNIIYLNALARAHWAAGPKITNPEWITQILAPDYVEEFVQAWDEVVSGSSGGSEIRCSFRTAKTPEGVFQGVGRLIRYYDDGGKFRYVLGKIRDVSELDRMNRELQEEKDLLDALIQSVGVGLVIVDRARNIFYQNENALNRYGVPADRKCYSQFGLSQRCEECALEQIKSGAYLEYYDQMYGKRLAKSRCDS